MLLGDGGIEIVLFDGGECRFILKLLSVRQLDVLSCRNLICSIYLHFGCNEAAAPDFCIRALLSRYFFKLYF